MDRLFETLAQWRSASNLFPLALLMALTVAMTTAPAVRAAGCSLDDRPGATLLLP